MEPTGDTAICESFEELMEMSKVVVSWSASYGVVSFEEGLGMFCR